MDNNKPVLIAQFPLTERSARKIIIDLATNHTARIRLSKHVRQRMDERSVTLRQILSLLKSPHSLFSEGPYQSSNGDWKFNLRGIAAGQLINLVVALRNHDYDPTATLITVWIN